MIKNRFNRSVASIVLAVSLFSMVSVFSAQAVFFSDVSSSTDYQTAIQWAQGKGIVSGFGDGTFKPDACVRRAELLKIIYAYNPSISLDVKQTRSFSDVGSSDWFYKYVNRAVYDGVVSGYPDGSFKPNNCVNRAEAMKISTNALFNTPNLGSFGGVVFYDDKLVADIHSWDWFAPYSNFLFKKRLVGTNHTVFAGIVNEVSEIKFFPEGFMSRKEVVELIYNYDLAYGRTNPTPSPTLTTPTLSSPANGANFYNGTYNNGSGVILSWNPVQNATAYDITLTSGVAGYTSFVYSVNSATTNYYVPSNNLPPITAGNTVVFNWKVRAYDASHNYLDSATWSFRGVGQQAIPNVTLGTPTLSSPTNGTVFYDGTYNNGSGVILYWNPAQNATGYDITLTSGVAGYTSFVYSVNSASTNYYVPSNNLPPITAGNTVVFNWKVRAYDASHNYLDSATWSFRGVGQVIQPVIPGTPVLSSPTDNQVILTQNVLRQTTLRWSSVSGAASYQVELGCDFCNGLVEWSNPTTYSTTNNYYGISAEGDNPMRFRVRALNSNSEAGAWSDFNHFRFNTAVT